MLPNMDSWPKLSSEWSSKNTHTTRKWSRKISGLNLLTAKNRISSGRKTTRTTTATFLLSTVFRIIKLSEVSTTANNTTSIPKNKNPTSTSHTIKAPNPIKTLTLQMAQGPRPNKKPTKSKTQSMASSSMIPSSSKKSSIIFSNPKIPSKFQVFLQT